MGVSVLEVEENKHFRRAANRRDAGFTLIEILIVIVVLGLLAAVVLFALGGITSKSAQAACKADGATVSEAISDLNSEFPNVFAAAASTSGVSAENLLLGTAYSGPYISSWPSNSPHYAFSVSSAGVLQVQIGTAGTLGATVTYAGPSSCPSNMS
jgi:prepilin-type N-terminal cleavage/methylation domain-containing protein